MIKNDRWIKEQAALGMIQPFEPSCVRKILTSDEENAKWRNVLSPGCVSHGYDFGDEKDAKWRNVLSFGCGSYGYDLTLSPHDFQIFRHIPGTVINPKRFKPNNLEPAQLHSDADGQYFILPGHGYALGVPRERIEVPPNVTVICLGKSTYARCGIIANITPFEAGWKGYPTLEFSNSSAADCRVYANEGIVQCLFFEGDPCETTYDDRAGKYQDQPAKVTLATI
jgi:dCTP deaminase